MSADENNLIWIDLEMTGLDPERDETQGRLLDDLTPSAIASLKLQRW